MPFDCLTYLDYVTCKSLLGVKNLHIFESRTFNALNNDGVHHNSVQKNFKGEQASMKAYKMKA
jgi:hypothetical protein